MKSLKIKILLELITAFGIHSQMFYLINQINFLFQLTLTVISTKKTKSYAKLSTKNSLLIHVEKKINIYC